MDVDPLDVLYKAIRLQEHIAAKEQRKGDKANTQRMADAMRIAAELSVQAAAIEHRLGISSSRTDAVSHITVEFVTPTKPDHIAEKDRRNAELQAEVRSLQRQLAQRTAGVATSTDLPADPMLIAPSPLDGNVVPLVQPQSNAAPLSEHEKRQRTARQQHDAALRGAPVVNAPASERYADVIPRPDAPAPGRPAFERFDYPKSGVW